MAFKFDDEIDWTSVENTDGQETFYPADTDYGRIGDLCNVSANDMLNEVSKQTDMACSVETSTFPDLSAMAEIVARTCTVGFHKRKGYIDNDEQSVLTLQQLERLFGIPEQTEPDRINLNHTFRNRFTAEINQKILNNGYDAIFEADDFFIYIIHENGGNITLDSIGWQTPSLTHKPYVCYILTRKEIDRWTEENKWLEDASTMMDRISTKPILMFYAKEEIIRDNQKFSAMDIYNALHERAFDLPVLLEFMGVYHALQEDDDSLIVLSKTRCTYALN